MACRSGSGIDCKCLDKIMTIPKYFVLPRYYPSAVASGKAAVSQEPVGPLPPDLHSVRSLNLLYLMLVSVVIEKYILK